MPAIFVLGGGVAGAASALSLRKTFPLRDIYILERNETASIGGHGMILLRNGIAALKALGVGTSQIVKTFRPIKTTTLTDCYGDVLFTDKADERKQIYCCTREAIIDGLYDTFSRVGEKYKGKIHLKNKKECVDIELEDGYVTNIHFADGTSLPVEKSDLVVGADGYRSLLCATLNQPSFHRPHSQVFELVTSTAAPLLAAKLGSNFKKVVLPREGLSFGILSPSVNRVIGFIQFDTKRHITPRTETEYKELFERVVSLIESNEHELFLEYASIVTFDDAHVWRPVNADLPPVMNARNSVLIGDAAHPFLPFTSQGVSAALMDAVCLSRFLKKVAVNEASSCAMGNALNKFVDSRVRDVSQYVSGGRAQLEKFLSSNEKDVGMPYIQSIDDVVAEEEDTSYSHARPDFSSVDLEQLKKKAYNFKRWATIPDGTIPLTAADSDFAMASPIKDAIIKYVSEGHMNYGPASGLPEFRQAIARTRSISPDQVFVTNSAASSMFLIAQYCLSPGDEVILPDPVDFLFQGAIENAGGAVKRYALVSPEKAGDGSDHWTFRLDEVAKLVTSRTKMIAICNPHNPVGRVWAPEELRQLCDIAVRHDLKIWSDEVWSDISYVPFHPTATLKEEYRSRTFTVTGFSKGYGLAGMRLGAVLCPTEQDAEAIASISLANDTAYGVPILSQVAGMAALEHCREWQDAFTSHVKSQCKYAVETLNRLPHVSCKMPEGTFVCFVDVSYYLSKADIDEESLVEYLCQEAAVAVVPGSPRFFGSMAAGHIRISVATSRDVLHEALDRISMGLSNLLVQVESAELKQAEAKECKCHIMMPRC